MHMAPFTSSEDTTKCFSCHDGRIKAIEAEPGNPFLFWSASEDGTVRQFDRRLPDAGCRRGSAASGAAAGNQAPQGGRRDAGNCLVALTADERSPESPFVARVGRGGTIRAMHLACNPSNSNYLAVACGDLVARVFDRRVLSLGPATDARSGGRSPAMAFCPAHEHPLAGKACGITSPDSRMTMSPLVTGHHSTCVSFRPDGRELLVSYHRDHVYLFDSSGARRSSGGKVGDLATCSYFLPHLPPPSPPPGATAAPAPSQGSGEGEGVEWSGAGKRWREGKRKDRAGGDGFRRNWGVPRGGVCADSTTRILEAHRALTMWDGRGVAPVSATELSALYTTRSGELSNRGWRGDRYLALLDVARAKELAPDSADILWEYVEALSNTGRERAARGEARRSARKFPALEAKAQALLYPVSTGSGGSGSGGTGGSTGGSAGANGGAGGARSISRPGFTPAWQRDLRIGVVIGDVNEGDAQAGGAADRDDEEEEDQEEASGGGGFREYRTPPARTPGTRRRGHRARPRDVESDSDDEGGTSPPPSSWKNLNLDRLLAAEERAAAGWYRTIIASDTRDCENSDLRCPPDRRRPKDEGAGSGGKGEACGGEHQRESAPSFDRGVTDHSGGGYGYWEDAAATSSERSQLDVASPRAMIQRYAGACNVQTDIKEACFLGDNGDYIAAGSDDGRLFVWERESGRLVRAVPAVTALATDDKVLNCVQPHPSLPILATSGLDNVVRVWSPIGQENTKGEEDRAEGVEATGMSAGALPSLGDIARHNQGNMDPVGVSMRMALQPLMRQLVMQITTSSGADADAGPGECTQA